MTTKWLLVLFQFFQTSFHPDKGRDGIEKGVGKEETLPHLVEILGSQGMAWCCNT